MNQPTELAPTGCAGPLQAFMVGGAVRDTLLGRPVSDRDWVVVGATPQEMVQRGYLSVGLDFPVFLHPVSREEYALARTQRKFAPAATALMVHSDPSVTLEEDLSRRDLTINAMAMKPGGVLVDPCGGQADLKARVLRHVSDAFREDPVRILRVARFAARYPDFTVAPETMELMRELVLAGQVDYLMPERVWKEISRGLRAEKPSRMLEVLRECGALARLLPEVDRLAGVPQPPAHHPEVDTFVHVCMVLDQGAKLRAPLPAMFACLCHDLGKGTTPADVLPRHLMHERRSVDLIYPLVRRMKVPNDCRDTALITAREHGNIHASGTLDGAALLRLLERCNAFRYPERFEQVLLACEADARGRLGLEEREYPQSDRLRQVYQLASSVDTASVAARAIESGRVGAQIGEAIRLARMAAVKEWVSENPGQPREDRSAAQRCTG